MTAEATARETPAIERVGRIDRWRADALSSLLKLRPYYDTAGLPLLWHLVQLLDSPGPAELGPDGHPAHGIPSPPEPGRRRMWAGGRVRTLGPLRPDVEATRRTSARGAVDKVGRSGRLTFVTVAHEIIQNGRTVVKEEQDILYRPAQSFLDTGRPVAEPAEPIVDADSVDARLDTDPVLLFRFSALTYNGHRIHYDRDYAQTVEGYPGLLVHGPLQALMMAEMGRHAAEHDGPAQFSYRLVAPLFDGSGLTASALASSDGFVTTVRDDSGRLTATGHFVAHRS